MARNYRKKSAQDKILSFLRRVDEVKLKITEKNDKEATELLDPSAEEIYSELSKGECTLFFYKMTDGRHRKMRCTLNQDEFSTKYSSQRLLKTLIVSQFANGKHNKEGLVPVWDLDADGWKSFYLNRVYRLVRNEQTDAE